MQLDIFEHSRDVVLRNAAIDALRERDTGASAQAVAALAAEYCARLLLGLLLFERQGRHAELVEGRRRLREAHPALFARYMQSR